MDDVGLIFFDNSSNASICLSPICENCTAGAGLWSGWRIFYSEDRNGILELWRKIRQYLRGSQLAFVGCRCCISDSDFWLGRCTSHHDCVVTNSFRWRVLYGQ